MGYDAYWTVFGSYETCGVSVIVVGCPVKNRNWVLPLWKSHVDAAFEGLDEVKFVFALDSGDNEPLDVFNSWGGFDVTLVRLNGSSTGTRDWSDERHEYMAWARNQLLAAVREMEPDLFLSLDSDILLDPGAVRSAMKVLSDTSSPAVALKTYLSQTGEITNGANWVRNRTEMHRIVANYACPADIIAAAKLMTPEAYCTDYSFHHFGEDIGWSLNVMGKHGRMYFDGSIANKHLMSQQMLSAVDKRIGW